MIRCGLFLLLALACAVVDAAPSVYVMSIGASSVQVILNQNVVRTLSIGETAPEGVKLQGIENGAAVFNVDGRLVRMTLGASTTSQIVLRAGADGQFRVTAYVNGNPVRAIIDTGASSVAMSSALALKLGIDYRRGQPGTMYTANGSVASYGVLVRSVQIGDVVVTNVPASVQEGREISRDVDVLIGHSFLRNVQLQQSGTTMMISRPNGF